MPDETMRFASAITDEADPAAAIQSLVNQVTRQLGEDSVPHFAVLFISSRYRTALKPLVGQLRNALGKPFLLGCTGGGVLGEDVEVESSPAMALAAAYLPRVELHPFTVSLEDLDESQEPGFWIEKLGATPAEDPVGILLPDPFSCDVMALLNSLNSAYPKMPLIGGLASSADTTGGTALFYNQEVLQEGAVGVLLTGDIQLRTIVSQGCRPIGRPYIITKAQENVIFELAGVPAVEALRQLLVALSASDRALAQRALFLGVVMNEHKDRFRRGDFVVRNLVGLDPSSGAIAIGDRVQVGQTVQFQLRDAETSREDLQQLLTDHAELLKMSPSVGALLFSCLGRGRDLYGEPHYDIRTIQAAIGHRPIAGFFCNGEIGPIGGRNFLHGFTSSLGLFSPRLSTPTPAA